MPRFLAVSSRGLHQALLLEMQERGFQGLKKGPSGVEFEGSWKECYRANMILKNSPRILKPILDFPAYNKDEFYNNAKKHDFTKYITPNQTLAVQSTIKDSNFKDQRYPSMLLKDVVVDQFQEKFGERPSVDRDNPDLPLSVKIYKNQVSISLDTSGFSLSQRGYRSEAIEAPIKEHVAAALLKLMKWTKEEPLYDPVCGSATFLIEASMWDQVHLNENFSFRKWQTYQKDVYEELLAELKPAEAQTEAKRSDSKVIVRSSGLARSSDGDLSGGKNFIAGSDISPKNLDVAKISIANSKAKSRIHLFQIDFFNVNTKILNQQIPNWPEKGLILMNPPYDLRLKTRMPIEDLYDQLIEQCHKSLPGWRIGMLAPADLDERTLRLIPDSVANFESGGLKIKLLRYRNAHKD
jgi:23S rRNA G2445 N2-methylase RlmL